MSLLAVVVALNSLLQVGCHEPAKAPPESAAVLVEAQPRIGQKENQAAPTSSKPGPRITFEKVTYNFGDVTARKKYTCEFKFTNTGDGTLKILQVRRCCGTVTKLAKKEFKPGENGVLEVEYLSGPSASTIRRKLYVSSNDETNPKVELTISAKVVPKVAYEPKRLNLVLKEENAGCPKITLTSTDGQAFSIGDFRSTGESITIDVDSSVESTEFVLEPKVDLEKLQNRPVGFISIDLTHPECKKVTLSFSTLLSFEFKPQSINIFNPEPHKPLVKKISLVSNYGEDFEVESTSSEKGIAKVISQEKTSEGYQFEVEITAPPADETWKFGDVVNVHLKGGETLAIKCYGRYLIK